MARKGQSPHGHALALEPCPRWEYRFLIMGHALESGQWATFEECLAPYLRRRCEEQPNLRRTLDDVAVLARRGSFQTASKRLGELRHLEERHMRLEEKTLFPILENLTEPTEAVSQAKAEHQAIRRLLDALNRSLSIEALNESLAAQQQLSETCAAHWQHEQELLAKHVKVANQDVVDVLQSALSHC